jgi:hypothetical protein
VGGLENAINGKNGRKCENRRYYYKSNKIYFNKTYLKLLYIIYIIILQAIKIINATTLMVLEDFCYYSIFESASKAPPDEIVYQRMQETTSAIKRTDSGDFYYDTVYSPRLPYTTVRTYDDYVAYNDVIKQHKMLNDKKEINENRVLFFLREMFCCR